MPDSGVRLKDLLVAMSMATDLGMGQPAEHMLRAARISMRIGERLGLADAELATLYDVGMLTYVGCPVYGNESSLMFGDDIEFRARALEIDLAGFPALVFMLRRAGAGTPALNRVRQAAGIIATQGRGLIEQMANHCSAAGVLADRLGLGPSVMAGIEQSYARWDGQGVPAEVRGDAIALTARISHVAEACEVFHRTGGVADAVAMVEARSGTHFDPAVVDAVRADPESLFAGLADDTVESMLDAEPVPRPPLDDDELDTALAAIGDFCDLRSPYFAGHSRSTAELVTTALASTGLPAADVTLARRAAYVHDVGRFGVPGSVWDKSGPLTGADRERMRMHAYYVERIFSRPEPLRRIGLLAATHHERMDGSGYHRGLGGTMLSTPARALAAADAYCAMTQDRPHRPALTEADAARELRREAAAGRLDPNATDAVLAAAGHGATRGRAAGPFGLTARECEVLVLLAQGLTNKSIGRQLHITPKTVGNHVERVYAKLGVGNRAGAALRAMEQGLVGRRTG